MSRLRPLVLALVGALAGVALVAAPAQAATATISGFVRNTGGDRFSGVVVRAVSDDAVAAWAETASGADGSYSLAVPIGRAIRLEFSVHVYVTDDLEVKTSSIELTGDRVEDLYMPYEGAVTAKVLEGDDGSPVANATVKVSGSTATMTTPSGLVMDSVLNGWTCHTGDDGTCPVLVITHGDAAAFTITPPGRPAETFPGFYVPTQVPPHTFTVAPAPPVSGVLRRADGSPVAGAQVRLVGSQTASTSTKSDGSWSLRSKPGSYRIDVTGSTTGAGWTLPYEFETAQFQHDAARTVDLSLASLDTVGINVRSSNGVPMDNAWVQSIGDLSTRSGSTPDGLPVTLYLNRNGALPIVDCHTSSDGRCTMPVLSGGSSGQIRIAPPLPTQFFPPTPYVPGQPREVTVQLTAYALATSAGSRPGTVIGGIDRGDVPEFDTRPVTLPDGLDPVVGRIDYRATLAPGASSALFSVDLPNTNANAMFRQKPDGGLELLSSWGGEPGFFDVVDGSAADADGVVNGSVSGNIIPVAIAPLTISTTELPSAAAQKPYSARLEGSGPGAPMVWSVDPNYPLPGDLKLSPDGVLSGTAPGVGTYAFRVLMTDSRGWQVPATQQLSLQVDKVAVLTSSLPDAYIGGAYSSTLSFASGSLPTWTLASGALPPGLKLGAGNGTISGTPTAAGTYSFGVVVKANGSTSQRRILSITVRPMEIATASLPDPPVWSAYSQKLTTRGGKATLVWSLAGGSLPPGVALSSAGALSGKPTTVGSYPVTFNVKDALGQVATKSFVITVTPMTITTSALPDAKKGQYYASKLAASGGKATLAWSIVGGALPTGLTLSAAGNISGYPKTPGTWTFTVKVTDSSVPKNIATRTLSITVT